jgi:hypothetical protein
MLSTSPARNLDEAGAGGGGPCSFEFRLFLAAGCATAALVAVTDEEEEHGKIWSALRTRRRL